MSERPTLETDAESGIEMFDENGQSYISQVVDADFARKLERERDDARNKMADALQEVDLRTLDFERMKQERDEAREALEEEKKFHHRTHRELVQTQCKVLDLTQAIIATLEENRHLADGDDCTLAKLKSEVPEWK
jgi:hypothetical protein